MPQGSGFLNTAPSPIPGGYGNPAGANMGLPTTAPGTGVPSVGAIPTSLNPASQKTLPQSLFPANTGGSTGSPIPGAMGSLSSGFGTGTDPAMATNLYNYLGKAYGKGPGTLLGNMLTKGLFTPEVAQALMNAMEPTIQRGFQDVLGAFGSEGARFSSAAAIGAGDYMSQARLGQEAQLANIYQQDQAMQLNLLEQVLPTIHQERSDEGGWLSKILGGLSSVAGLIPGIGPAISAIGGIFGHKSSNSGGAGASSSIPGGTWQMPGTGGSSNAPLGSSADPMMQILQMLQMQSSGGETLGMPSSSSSPLGGGIFDETGMIGMH